jgi:hypothetical protein
MPAVKTSNVWTRPAIFAFVWILAAALTLSELATVNPALQAASELPAPTRPAFGRSAGARAHPIWRLAMVP